LELVRQYGPEPVADAIAKACAARAFGADYVANILGGCEEIPVKMGQKLDRLIAAEARERIGRIPLEGRSDAETAMQWGTIVAGVMTD
jgi:hypothetical protein